MTDIDNAHELRGEARDALQRGAARDQARDRRAGRDARAAAGQPARRRPRAARGRPGLAKTLTVKTLAAVLGGSYSRIQFTPDLVPADLVGTRVYRPDTGGFDTELGPVFCNFLLADEINRAPAKVQSALLEVMQEQQVTIGGTTLRGAAAVHRDGDAEPDRVRGHLPAARGAGRPLPDEDPRRLPEHRRGGGRRRTQPRRRPRPCRSVLALADLRRYAAAAETVLVDREMIGYAVALADATRHPAAHGLSGHRAADRVRREPARADRPRPGRARARAAARPRPRHARRRPRPRRRRAAPPDRAVLRRAQRRRDRRPAARAGAGRRTRARRRGPDPRAPTVVRAR